MAARFVRRYPALRQHREDVESAALEGLAEAASKFDRGRGVDFMAFAYYRILGAMRDYVRSLDVVGRDIRRAATDGREDALELAALARPLDGDTLEEALRTVGAPAPQDDELMRSQMRSALASAMRGMRDRDRRILRGLYLDGLTLHDLAAELGLTESRICQIRGELLRRLREHHRLAAYRSTSG
ncbi:MAG TPA: sigma-70 family RNA polymerase sigma factor [Salinarimonas sp.]|nr:sigma-70 family RNA polymerase sigma factor [Salinarimonas sp.]